MILEDESVARIRAALPGEVADVWVGLLQPALRLSTEYAAAGPVVGRLGGEPALPDEMPWPEWDGIGPLSFVAALDCGALPAGDIGLELPEDGTLLFFYYDGQVEGELFVDLSYPSTQAGARVVYVPGDMPAVPRTTPAALRAYPEVPVRAQRIISAPTTQNPVWLEAVAGLPPELLANAGQTLMDAGSEGPRADTCHQVGGYPVMIQGDVLMQVTGSVLGRLAPDSPLWSLEARRWVMLVQIDTDSRAEMCWGDLGVLHWFIRQEDLAVRDFDRALMTWECA